MRLLILPFLIVCGLQVTATASDRPPPNAFVTTAMGSLNEISEIAFPAEGDSGSNEQPGLTADDIALIEQIKEHVAYYEGEGVADPYFEEIKVYADRLLELDYLREKEAKDNRLIAAMNRLPPMYRRGNNETYRDWYLRIDAMPSNVDIQKLQDVIGPLASVEIQLGQAYNHFHVAMACAKSDVLFKQEDMGPIMESLREHTMQANLPQRDIDETWSREEAEFKLSGNVDYAACKGSHSYFASSIESDETANTNPFR
ncbi:hypothetical protein [Pseudorhizobium flavum]|uniref:hypothetical protein n=1 Tax=Pseudorhizobium flavum TaxID=1335061 RepID=UPI00376F4A25